jgi:hypothetical protein
VFIARGLGFAPGDRSINVSVSVQVHSGSGKPQSNLAVEECRLRGRLSAAEDRFGPMFKAYRMRGDAAW